MRFILDTQKGCPICNSTGPHPLGGAALADGEQVDSCAFVCRACESWFYLPPPRPDYTAHTASEFVVRDYVELNADIYQLVNAIASAIETTGAKTLLDVGCGFGFGIDAARRLYEVEVQGAEPSSWGQRGSRVLGVPIHNEFLRSAADLGNRKFNLVHSSEVIEHVDRPQEFVNLLKQFLTPDGLLVVSTPDPRLVREVGDSVRQGMASPGAHCTMISQAGMRSIMEAEGFPHLAFLEQGGSYVCYAARTPFSRIEVDGRGLTERYLGEVAREASWPPLRTGAAYRLFRSQLDAGDYESARLTQHWLPKLPLETTGVGDLQSLLERFPSCAAGIQYYRAVLAGNADADHRQAAALFRSAASLSLLKIQLAPSLAAVEADMLWRARYHEALMTACYGDWEGSSKQLAQIEQELPTALVPLPTDLRPRIDELAVQSRQHLAVASA